ncbi:hypothetical protein MCOR22_011610 [Pyricularia oryzae]|nr:hypothetical protein MCOR22_011610 [Pyricularia oryzae]KAI6442340.1 hypothetical protein MCOR15_011446 [Pyricularia oryzae]
MFMHLLTEAERGSPRSAAAVLNALSKCGAAGGQFGLLAGGQSLLAMGRIRTKHIVLWVAFWSSCIELKTEPNAAQRSTDTYSLHSNYSTPRELYLDRIREPPIGPKRPDSRCGVYQEMHRCILA